MLTFNDEDAEPLKVREFCVLFQVSEASAPVEPPSLNCNSVSEPAGDVVAVIPVIPVPSPLKYEAEIYPDMLMFPPSELMLIKSPDKLPVPRMKSPLALMEPDTFRAETPSSFSEPIEKVLPVWNTLPLI